MSDPFKTVLLFGAPGVGKGTQGKCLAAIPGFYHCGSGDVFRRVDAHSELGKIFFAHSSRGELVPDDVTVQMWHGTMNARVVLGDYKPRRELLILDGIPRTPNQVELMKEHVETLRVVHLETSDVEAMVQRLLLRARKQNRHDDADPKVIRRRWDVYERETKPVLSRYPQELVTRIDAMGSPAQVLAEVLKVIAPIHREHFEPFEG